MPSQTLYFQYCPKLILFSNDWTQVLLVRRKGEADYDGTFSFVGGKTETTDADLLDGVRREKNEEIGEGTTVEVCMTLTRPLLFRKKSGDSMIIPHHIAHFLGGEITLNPDEYSEYQWVSLDKLEAFEPKIQNIPELTSWAVRMRAGLQPEDFTKL